MFFREVENRFAPDVVPLSLLLCDVDEPIVETISEAVHRRGLSHNLVEVQSTFVKGVPNFDIVAIIEVIEGTRTNYKFFRENYFVSSYR